MEFLRELSAALETAAAEGLSVALDIHIELQPRPTTGRPRGTTRPSSWTALRILAAEQPNATPQQLREMYAKRWATRINEDDPTRPEITDMQQVYDARKWVKRHGNPREISSDLG